MSIINPDPSDWARLLPWLGSWNCLKNSSNGDPGGKDGILFFLSSIIALLSVAPSLLNKSKKFSSQIPFGPYIILGTLIYLIFESNIRSIIFY